MLMYLRKALGEGLAKRNLLYSIWEQNWNKGDLSTLKFIDIKPELTGENIMVSQYIEGETFDKLLKLYEDFEMQPYPRLAVQSG